MPTSPLTALPDASPTRHGRGLASLPYHAVDVRSASVTPIPERPILVVDDDAKIVRLVRTYLEREGFTRRRPPPTGRPPSTPSRPTDPALVVLDLMLPELDGRAVIRAVRRDDEAARDADPRAVGPRLDASTGSPASRTAPTTTCPSRSRRPSSSCASRRSSAARRRTTSAGAAPTRPPDRPAATSSSTAIATRSRRDGEPIALTRVEFRLLQTHPRGRRARPQPRPAPRRRLRRATRPTSSTGPSTSTSAGCATSSATTPTCRATSRPSAASATGPRRRRRAG